MLASIRRNSVLWMRRDRNEGDHRNPFLTLGFVGTVVPKNSISSGSIVLRVGLEHFLAVGTGQGCELVRIEAGMMRIYFQVTETLANLMED